MQRYLVVAAVLCAGVGVAVADSSSIQYYRFDIHNNNSTDLAPPSDPVTERHYFNYAACECSWAWLCNHGTGSSLPYGCSGSVMMSSDYQQYEFGYELHGAAGAGSGSGALTSNETVQIWTGNGDCTGATPEQQMTQCQNLSDGSHAVSDGDSFLASQLTANPAGVTAHVSLYDLMIPEAGSADTPRECSYYRRVAQGTMWALASSTGGNLFDFSAKQSVPPDISTDTQPPWGPPGKTSVPLPTGFQATGTENGIHVSWANQLADTSDIAYIQALCAHTDGTPALSKSSFTPQYETPFMKCGYDNRSEDVPITFISSCTSARVPAAADGGVDAPGDAADAGVDAPPDADPGAPDAGTPDGGACAGGVPQPEGFVTLDKSYLCGEVDNPGATTSIDIKGLENDQPYIVEVLAIDNYGNAAGVYFNYAVTPHPVTDVWEDLHGNSKYQVKGGFCLFADTYGDGSALTHGLRRFRDDTLASTGLGRALTHAYYAHVAGLGALVQGHLVVRIVVGVLLLPVVAFALLWHLITLPGILALLVLGALVRRRRLRFAHAAAAAAALVCLLAPGRAHAQSPYWEDPMQPDQGSAPTLGLAAPVRWHVGVRVGPYTPQIDAQYQAQTMTSFTPYQDMFGKGLTVMPMLDVDRVLWHEFGADIGLSVSAGYLSKSAHAWADCSTTDGMNCTLGDPDRKRAGDTNSFHLIPLAVSALVRYTRLDDDYGIPLVPYVRAGLGYYVWWVQGPNSIANVGGDKALGATPGFVGAVGLAIRAERIDRTAAISMRESGIQHAGFFAEYDLAPVDGFGDNKKLSVGDSTWYGGVEFEF